MERRNDERDRLRQACADEIRELYEADDDEATSPQMVADVAARTAARTARQLSRPDSDEPPRVPWHQTTAGRRGVAALASAIVTALVAAAVTGAIQALQAAGILK